MVSRPTLMPHEVARRKVEAFDNWMSTQPRNVQDVVLVHLDVLIDIMGPDSAKLLLGEIYLATRRLIHIENKYGGIR